jgi:hypothetical protein
MAISNQNSQKKKETHLHLAPKVRQQISPGQSDAATEPHRAALGEGHVHGAIALKGHNTLRRQTCFALAGLWPVRPSLPRAARRGSIAASLCPGLVCCRTFGAQCKCASGKH